MPNRLALETSPYLLQHAHNPVDWYPWGEEAFEKARREHKPIFLSVGYATCHWCHVMERESFENPQIAAFMNQHFVNIKVDREERPDVDHVYMSALQALSGSGGWPMNMFLKPDLWPFFGGTYWPPESRQGFPGFPNVLAGVLNAWQTNMKDVDENADTLATHLKNALRPRSAALSENLHEGAMTGLARNFDPAYGGFGGAPKFPQSPALLYLLAQTWLGDQAAQKHLELTLDRMMEGGIYDQVGGGFHRYAVDGIWRVPHFEKMLYDNAQLARVYAGAARVWAEGGGQRAEGLRLSALSPLTSAKYARIAREICEYVLAEMTGEDGGFYSAQDADSEGIEGKFYVWSEAEIRQILGDDADAAIKLFGASEAGNWEGVNILERRFPDAALREQLALSEGEYGAWVDGLRRRLYAVRKERVWPLTDDKVLADWNGLMLRALAEVGRLLGEPRYLDAARRNARFVLGTMLQGGLLRHSWRAGQLKPQAFLTDQANYGLGLLELYGATDEPEWLEAARQLGETVVTHFKDEDGGFKDSLEAGLPVKVKDVYDGPYPSGSASAAELLFRLAAVFERPEWHEAAMSAVEVYAQSLQRSAFGFPALLQAHLVGTRGTELAMVSPAHWVDSVRQQFLPLTTLVYGEAGSLPVLADRTPGMAYLCQHGACRLPAGDLGALERELRQIYG